MTAERSETVAGDKRSDTPGSEADTRSDREAVADHTLIRSEILLPDGRLVKLSADEDDQTVFDDDSVDRLLGQQGSDWYFADLGRDQLQGLKSREQIG